MKIHYQNIHKEERFIENVIHIQNLDNEIFEALLENGKTLTLRVEGIEGIYADTRLAP
jgi:predicted transcriptional regulator